MYALLRDMVRRRAGIGLFALLLCPGAVLAQDLCPSGPFLVLNLAGDENIANKAIAIPRDAEEFRTLLDSYREDRSRPKQADNDALFNQIQSHLSSNDNRWITRKGQWIAIYIVWDDSTHERPNLEVKDDPRKSRLALDLETLSKLAKALGVTGPLGIAPDEDSTIFVIRSCFQLLHRRSTLVATATADLRNQEEEEEGEEGEDEETPSGAAKASATVTTGPVEHAFLSADLPVNDVDELKLDSGELVEKETPSQFYVGFDYMLGDVLSEQQSFAQGLTFKILVEASSDPLNSYGAAVGLRLKSINALGFQLDTFSPFVGYIWNTNDTEDGDEELEGDWRFGISLNLDKALTWVQGNGDGD